MSRVNYYQSAFNSQKEKINILAEISTSTYIWWILHREKKSWNSIGYCPRKMYWKILHCRLWRISRNAITHVSDCLSSLKIFFQCNNAVHNYKQFSTSSLSLAGNGNSHGQKIVAEQIENMNVASVDSMWHQLDTSRHCDNVVLCAFTFKIIVLAWNRSQKKFICLHYHKKRIAFNTLPIHCNVAMYFQKLPAEAEQKHNILICWEFILCILIFVSHREFYLAHHQAKLFSPITPFTGQNWLCLWKKQSWMAGLLKTEKIAFLFLLKVWSRTVYYV